MYNTISRNKTTGCRHLVNYFDKEESLSRDFVGYLDKDSLMNHNFFNGQSDTIDRNTVISDIDKAGKGLSNNEARFFSLTFNPSADEIRHLRGIAENAVNNMDGFFIQKNPLMRQEAIDGIMCNLLKEYTVNAMNIYAQNFGRENISSEKDIVWFGRVEGCRYWKRDGEFGNIIRHNEKILKQINELNSIKTADMGLIVNIDSKVQNLKAQLIKESDIIPKGTNKPITHMMPKAGDNYHVHVIVGRKDKSGKVKLSPLARERKSDKHIINGKECQIGFNRDTFTQKLEKSFDHTFDYHREFKQSYEYRKIAKSRVVLTKDEFIRVAKEWEKERGFTKEYPRKEYHKKEYFNKGYKQNTKQTKDKDISSVAMQPVTFVATKAGMDYINSSIKPYRQAFSVGIGTIKLLAKPSAQSQKQAMKLMGQTSSKFAQKMMGTMAKAVNPYSMAISMTSSLIRNLAGKSDSMNIEKG